jgi:hypothetical protein
MSEFVYLFRSTDAQANEAMGTAEQAQRSMQSWLAWIRDLETNGHLKNRGQPLERTGKVVRGSQKSVTDGPYAEAKDIVLASLSSRRATWRRRSSFRPSALSSLAADPSRFVR